MSIIGMVAMVLGVAAAIWVLRHEPRGAWVAMFVLGATVLLGVVDRIAWLGSIIALASFGTAWARSRAADTSRTAETLRSSRPQSARPRVNGAEAAALAGLTTSFVLTLLLAVLWGSRVSVTHIVEAAREPQVKPVFVAEERVAVVTIVDSTEPTVAAASEDRRDLAPPKRGRDVYPHDRSGKKPRTASPAPAPNTDADDIGTLVVKPAETKPPSLNRAGRDTGLREGGDDDGSDDGRLAVSGTGPSGPKAPGRSNEFEKARRAVVLTPARANGDVPEAVIDLAQGNLAAAGGCLRRGSCEFRGSVNAVSVSGCVIRKWSEAINQMAVRGGDSKCI